MSLDHAGEIEIVLACVNLVFLDFSDLGGEEPVAFIVVLQLRRDFESTAQRRISFGFDFLSRGVPVTNKCIWSEVNFSGRLE